MKGRRVADEDRVVGLHHADDAETTVPVDAPVDSEALRAEVRKKYWQVASDPDGLYHFHTRRRLAERLGYESAFVGALPDRAVESFAGVGNPFSLRRLEAGFVDIVIGEPVDTFAGAGGEGNARAYQVFGFTFRARRAP